MTILVTGGNGFLGKYIVKAIKENPKFNNQLLCPTSRELDLTDNSAAMDYFYRNRPDIIINAAAIVGGIKKNITYPFDIIQSNLKMSTNLFDVIYKYNIPYVYNLGTICSYPKLCKVPFHEDDLFAGKPEETNIGYSMSKRALYILQNSYRTQFELKGAYFLLANLYGAHDHFNDPENSHVIPSLICKFMNAIDHDESEVRCWGTGTATRSFLHVDDAGKIIADAALDQFDHAEPINIGADTEISIHDLAHMIGKLTGFEGDIVFTGEVSDGQPKRKLNVSRAKELLGWEAKTGLLAGLSRTIDWYQSNRDTIPTKGNYDK